MNITFYMSDVHACGHVRGEVMAREVNANAPNHDVVCKTDILISDYKRSNVMVFQRASDPAVFAKLQLAKKNGIKTIYDVDDDYLNTPKEFNKPYIYYSRPEVQDNIRKFLAVADAITVSTYELAKSLAPYSEKVPKFVIKNALDVQMWDKVFMDRLSATDDGSVTIGWMASGSHTIDAPLVIPAIKRIMKEYPNVKLHLIGWVGWEQLGQEFNEHKERIKVEPWTNIVMLPQVMADIDIGIAPLVDNLFNRAKSNIKWLQYAALGSPCVASDLAPYQDIQNGVDGFVVKHDDPDGWYDSLKKLVEDKTLRLQVGVTARKRLCAEFDMKQMYRNWISVFDKVAE